MVYSNRFIACVLVNGQPQKELANGTVPLPFGQEYSLRFRNKHNRRAVVKFTIDGENVSGNGYIVPANGVVDIHRHHDKDARFKFVSLDSPDAVDHGKNGPNVDGSKGVIEARFYLEKEQPVYKTVEHHHHHHHPYPVPQPYPVYPQPWPYKQPAVWRTNTRHKMLRSCGPAGQTICSMNAGTSQCASSGLESLKSAFTPSVELKDGCTVEGASSGQTFRTVDIQTENDYVVVRIILRGSEQLLAATPTPSVLNEAIFPDAQLPTYCTNCGAKRGRSSDKFCGQCGHKF